MSGKDAVLLGGRNYSKQDIEHATEDARTLIQQSPVLRTCFLVMIASRRLYMLAREALQNELQHGWEVANPALIDQTFVMSAQEKANEKFAVLQVQREMLAYVLPFLDILTTAERDGQTEETSGQVLSGGADDLTAGVGDPGAGTEAPRQLHEGGLEGQERGGEEGQAGPGSPDAAVSGGAD